MTGRFWILGFFACTTLSFAPAADAQVGHQPQSSPYRDVLIKHSVSYFAGYYQGATDPGNVAPNDGPMIGARYAIRLGGPIHLT